MKYNIFFLNNTTKKEFFLFPFEEDVAKEEELAMMEIAQLLRGKDEKTIKMILKVTRDIIEGLET